VVVGRTPRDSCKVGVLTECVVKVVTEIMIVVMVDDVERVAVFRVAAASASEQKEH
jgi:hypothetical protein